MTKDAYTQALYDLMVKQQSQRNRTSSDIPDQRNRFEQDGGAHENHDVNHHHDHHDDMNMEFYSPPKQVQFWDGEQIALHADWGQLFYDLTYVAAAYNCGG